MKALMQRDFFKIVFEECDKYAGKILFVEGQTGLNKDFYILPKPEIYWIDKDTYKEIPVNPEEYDDILAYVLDKIKDTEYSFIIYNR